MPNTDTPAPVETKVKAATLWSYLGSAGFLAALELLNDNRELLSALPGWVTVIVGPVLPALITFAAGWKARHTPRGLYRG